MVKPWETATIGDFLDFKNGLNKGKEFFGYGTPIVNYTDVYKNRGLKKVDIRGKVCLTPDEIHRFDVRKNDVFFTRTSETPDEVGMSSVLLEDVENGVFSGFVLRGRPKNDMFVPEYCKYCFSTEVVRNAIITGCTYTTRALTNGKQLSAIELPVPPKPEQKAIAETLSDIDALIVNLEKLIAKKKAIKQGAIHELLTGERRLPGFTGEWQKYKLDDLLKYEQPTKYIVKSTEYSEKGIPVLTAGKSLLLGYTVEDDGIYENLPVIIFDDFVTSSKYIDYKFKVKSSAMKMLTLRNERMNLKLIFALMQMIDFSPVDHQRHWISQYSQFEINMPVDIAEQNAIATILFDIDSEIDAIEKKLEKMIQIKQGIMSELLTGRIRLVDKEDA